MQGESFSQLIKTELRQLPKNGILIFNVCCLVVLAFLIGYIYDMGVLSQIPTAILDLDHTSKSELIAKQFAESDKFDVNRVSDYPRLKSDIKEGKATVGVVIPPGFSRDLRYQNGAEVLFVIDGTNYIVANTAFAKGNEILQTVNGGISLEILKGKGMLPAEAKKVVQPIVLGQKILYNENYNYAYYLSYGVCSAGIFSLLMTSMAITMSRQRDKKRFGGKELTAKIIVFGLFACIVTNIVFFLLQVAFKLPARGNFLNFFGLTFVYGFLIAAFALLLFTAAVTPLRIFQLTVFFATPLFFVTGYTWPLQSMPEILKPLYYLCPMTPFLNGARAALVMGADWTVALRYTVWQLIQVVIYLPAALVFYRWRLGNTAAE